MLFESAGPPSDPQLPHQQPYNQISQAERHNTLHPHQPQPQQPHGISLLESLFNDVSVQV